MRTRRFAPTLDVLCSRIAPSDFTGSTVTPDPTTPPPAVVSTPPSADDSGGDPSPMDPSMPAPPFTVAIPVSSTDPMD